MASSANATTSTFIKQEPGIGVTIKQEPGTLRSERLSSFRLPRDLTLGGINPAKIIKNNANKKVYTPNLNAVRHKNNVVKTSRDTTNLGRGRGRGDRSKNERGGGRGRGGRGALVQTSGLFSEGTGEMNLRRSSSVYSKNADGGDRPSSLRKPILAKREIKIDPEIERKNILDILGDDEDMDENMITIDSFTPITLGKTKPEIKSENFSTLNIKKETDHNHLTYPNNLNEFFSERKPQLFLLQLPDSLPGEGPEQKSDENSDETRASTPDPAASYCTMRQLDEGLIGKIIRYKSGITKLVIGESRFDIDLGMEPGLLQEAISLSTNRTERSGNFINLGQIQAKLSATPDWEYMFSKIS